jgi:hypothetical protein
VSEAGRKIKEKAVSIDGKVVAHPVAAQQPGSTVTLRVGRKIKRITLQP